MGLSFALDELRATGWSGLDSAGCAFDTDGRVYPSAARVRQEFAGAGFDLKIAEVAEYKCYRAEWAEAGGGEAAAVTQAVVGHSEAEAAVYALAQLRRGLVMA
jgi:hypothetical protein